MRKDFLKSNTLMKSSIGYSGSQDLTEGSSDAWEREGLSQPVPRTTAAL